MKRTKQCPKCKSLRIGLLTTQGPDDVLTGAREEVTVRTTRGSGHISSPFAIGLRPSRPSSEEVTHTVKTLHELEAYICTECGYFESYVQTPAEVPWDNLEGFRWVNPELQSDGPYR